MKKNSPLSMTDWHTKANIKLKIDDTITIEMELGDSHYDETFDRIALYEACKEDPFWLFKRIIAIDQSIERRNKKLELEKGI